jgi:hypothetical protein
MNTTTDVDLIVDNLQRTSEILDRCSNKESVYNSEYGHYLALMSLETRKMISEIRELDYFCGGVL